ncbi:MAG: glycerate kinase [Saprospiraceae bacterium]
MNILIAPSGFKESLMADAVADCIEKGVRRIIKNANIHKVPVVDGGEGFAKILIGMTGGTLHRVVTTGPVGQPVESYFGFLGGEEKKTAILEMAATAGLSLVPRDMRNPLFTTTYGLGELIRHALDAGAERILIGCGDSGTNDGGAGMVQALGARLLDQNGREIPRGAIGLLDLHTIDVTNLDPRLKKVQIDAACNPHVQLCGSQGVARIFGPQKGATPEQVELLDAALTHWGKLIEHFLGKTVIGLQGSGASGGLGSGLAAFLNATLHPRYNIIMKYQRLEEILPEMDLVITAEGAIDFQTPKGKVPAEVARLAKKHGVPVVVLAGTIGKNASDNYDYGIDAFSTILQTPCTLEHAISNCESLVESAAERLLRTILVGMQMSQRVAQHQPHTQVFAQAA